MPRGDSTGPLGEGPMTGRTAGYCAGNDLPGYASGACRRRLRMGAGKGPGFRRRRGAGGFGRCNRFRLSGEPGGFLGGRFPIQSDADMEKQVIENRVRNLQTELDAVKKRLEVLHDQSK